MTTKAEYLKAITHDKKSAVSGRPYDYSKVPDTPKMKDRILVTCPDHGEFSVFAMSHKKHGCRECGKIRISNTKTGQPAWRKFSLEQFITRAKSIHPDLDYSRCRGDLLSSVWKLHCPIHNVSYTQKVVRLIYDKSRGCPECQAEKAKGQHAARRLSGREVCEASAKELGYELLQYTLAQEPAVFRCPDHGKFKISAAYHLTQGVSICQQCRKSSSSAEHQLRMALIDVGIKRVEMHRRDLLAKHELDLYLPKYKVAIEVNGVYHHSVDKKDRNYHRNKTTESEGLGIILMHFTDLEIKKQLPLVVSMIKAKCGKFKRRVYARSLVVRPTTYAKASRFLDKHHIQGPLAGSAYLGLYDKRENGKYRLMALAVFGKPRFTKAGQWELLRFATRQEHQVVGGLSRLLSAFAQAHSGKLISYAHRSYSVGQVYNSVGFTRERVTPPSYMWHNGHVSYSRYQTQKHKLEQLIDDFDPDLSEHANMEANGFWALYNSGNILYSVDLSKWQKKSKNEN